MMEVVKFYFDTVALLFVGLMQKFEIFPGIPYGTWIIGLFVFGSFLSVIFLAIRKENQELVQFGIRSNRNYKNGTNYKNGKNKEKKK